MMDSRFAVKIKHLMDNPMESKGYMPQSNIGWNSSTTHMDRNSDFGQERFQGPERLTIRPREYNGETNWEDYFKYFERVCKLNRWQDEKLDYLWVSLVGPALEYAGCLSVDRTSDYASLCSSMERRFDAYQRVPSYTHWSHTEMRRKFSCIRSRYTSLGETGLSYSSNRNNLANCNREIC